MPSGGHGSRGGGRSGGSRGGSRSGGFSRSSSHRSYGGMHHPHHHHRHIRIRIGRHYYGYSNGGSPIVALLLFFIIFVGLIAMGTGLSRSGIKDEMYYYEQQHDHYKAMIDYAKEHRDEGYVVEATVIDRWYDDYSEKYYLEYRIVSNNVVLDGYTYPCYTVAETTGLVGKKIEVAVDAVPITRNTDSVDLAFADVTLEEDGDYMKASDSLKSMTTTFAITLTITILLIVLLVWYSIKKLKLEDEEPKAVEAPASKVENQKSYCAYCGTSCSPSATRCPNCGANLK